MFGPRSVLSLLLASVVWVTASDGAAGQWGIGLDTGDVGVFYEKNGRRHEGWGVRLGGRDDDAGVVYEQHRVRRPAYHNRPHGYGGHQGDRGYGGYGRSRTHIGVGIHARPAYEDQEVIIVEPDEAEADEDETPDVAKYARLAREAFRDGQYDQAIRHANHAIVEEPRAGRLHLLMAQALLAVGDYREAAVAVRRGMTLLDEDDWGHVVENYTEYYTDDAYVKQMKRLVEFVKQHPKAAHARFLRGYQYGYLDYPEAARRELAKAIELEPRDKMARHLLVRFGGKVPDVAVPAVAPKPPEDKNPAGPIPADKKQPSGAG